MEDEGDLSAQSLFDLIADTLSLYEQPWGGLLHVKDFMKRDVGLIDKVHKLMKKLSTVKVRALLRSHTSLAPVIRNDTCWSSTYKTLQRCTMLEPILRSLDGETVSVSELKPLLVSRSENICVTSLLNDLANFESVTKTLQGTTLTESGLVKIQRGKPLTAAERAACTAFRSDDDPESVRTQDDGPNPQFAAQAFKRRKTTKCSAYVNSGYVPPPSNTSNECERLFSRVMLIFSGVRKSMDRVCDVGNHLKCS
ncbi:hypothetical protein JG688_00018535 [Phytophthora aleatoria]|uniref:HAT C-terminal dimerisation domain-containing protein n=1 Tax=Phytophthora aleatoria TaxID=2496075 RepID=A0A8J5IPD6_9STRA|nr:hypothetical protein JG688_00018535 [Phytophthora aleatoria]